MTRDVMNSDQPLESACAQALARHAEALKEDLLCTAVLPNLTTLRAGNGKCWNEPGWYSALTSAQLQEFAAGGNSADSAGGPAPQGGNWYPEETDSRSGAVFRFFHRHAWLDLPMPPGPGVLCFAIPHVVMSEALAALTVTVAGVPVAHRLLPSSENVALVELPLDAGVLAQAGKGQALRIGFDTAVAAVPAMIHRGSTDWRLLSLAVTMPAWREA